MTAAQLSWVQGSRYALLSMPLAFVALPLHVNLPHHYAANFGMSLAMLGYVLLLTRALDALVDPLFGRFIDAQFDQGGHQIVLRWCVLAAVLLVLGFAALWRPLVQGGWLWLWLATALVVTYLSYSVLSIIHQTWGARWGGDAKFRAKVSAWREALGLSGVLLASILPSFLGYGWTTGLLAALLVLALCGLFAVKQLFDEVLKSKQNVFHVAKFAATNGAASPWRMPAFRGLIAVFVINGTASAIPATLLAFFVSDVLQASESIPFLLVVYFLFAGLSVPVWLIAVKHWGLERSWLVAMLLAIAAFASVLWMGPGDVGPFALVCAATGFALGADLVVPSSMLTGIVHKAGFGKQSEGQFFGWWTCVTKLNLALAAGLVLPLLALWGYSVGVQTTQSMSTLTFAYAWAPSALKMLAVAALCRFYQRYGEQA